MISAPLANDSSRVAKNTTNITTKHFASLRLKEEENQKENKNILRRHNIVYQKTRIKMSSVKDG